MAKGSARSPGRRCPPAAARRAGRNRGPAGPEVAVELAARISTGAPGAGKTSFTWRTVCGAPRSSTRPTPGLISPNLRGLVAQRSARRCRRRRRRPADVWLGFSAPLPSGGGSKALAAATRSATSGAGADLRIGVRARADRAGDLPAEQAQADHQHPADRDLRAPGGRRRPPPARGRGRRGEDRAGHRRHRPGGVGGGDRGPAPGPGQPAQLRRQRPGVSSGVPMRGTGFEQPVDDGVERVGTPART